MCLVLPAALAEVPQPTEQFWVLDQADVLTEATEGEIFFANQRLYDAAGAEIVVVTVETTDGMRLEDFCYALYNDWEISERGLLLTMAIADDDYYIMRGTAFETAFSSGLLGEMRDEALEPPFARGDYNESARRFFEAAFTHAADALNVDVSVADGIADYEAFAAQQGDASTLAARSGEWGGAAPDQPRPRGGNDMTALIIIVLVLLVLFGGTLGCRRRRPHGGTFVPPPHRFGGFVFRPRAPRPPRPPKPPHGGFAGPRPGGPRPRGGFFGIRPGGPRPGGGRPRGGFGAARRHSGGGGRTTRGGGVGRGNRR